MFLSDLYIPCENRFERIQLHTLLYARVSGGQTELVTTHGSFLSPVPISQLEKKLPADVFCRVHEGYLVALRQIISFSFDHAQIQLPGIIIPLGKKYQSVLRDHIRILGAVSTARDPGTSFYIDEQGRLQRAGMC